MPHRDWRTYGVAGALAISVLSVPLHSGAATGRARMPEWISCGGVAPAVTSCKVRFRVHQDFRIERLQSARTGIHPGAGFTGRVEAYWEGGSSTWSAVAAAVNGEQVPHRIDEQEIGYEVYSRNDYVGGFAPGDIVTMRADVTGTGAWRVRSRIVYLGTKPVPAWRWTACRGIAPQDSGCTLTVRSGRSFTFGMLADRDYAPLIYRRLGGFVGRITTIIRGRSGTLTTICTYYRVPTVVRSASCETTEDGRGFLAGEVLTADVTTQGVGAWNMLFGIQDR